MMVLMLIGATYSSTATVTSAAVARTLIMRVASHRDRHSEVGTVVLRHHCTRVTHACGVRSMTYTSTTRSRYECLNTCSAVPVRAAHRYHQLIGFMP